jgi:hypothetical protein
MFYRNNLRLKPLPKRLDVCEYLFSIFIVEQLSYFVHNSHQHVMLSIISSNVIDDSQLGTFTRLDMRVAE